jgi:hypothetical protein
MDYQKLKEKDKLKLLFAEIIKGYSATYYLNRRIFLKHLNIIDNTELDIQKDIFLSAAIDKGLPLRKDKEEYLIKEGLWDEDKNKQIDDATKFIKNLKLTKSKFFKQKDIDSVKEQIKNEESKLAILITIKKDLLGLTAEEYAIKKVNEFFIFNSLYSDKNLSIKFFSEADYEDLDEEQVNQLTEIYNDKTSNFSTLNLKKIAISPYFMNIYNISDDNPKNLYGKDIIDLTYYQIEVFNNARYFRNLLIDSKHKPSPEVYDDPEALIEWMDSSKSAEEILSKSKINKNKDFVATSIVGAQKEDLAKISKEKDVINLHDIADKKGGTLSMEDLIKLHRL